MNTQETSTGPPKTLPKGAAVVLSALFISLLALALAQQICGIETEIVRQLVPALAEMGLITEIRHPFENDSAIASLLQFGVLFLFSLLAILAAMRLKLKPFPLAIVTLQIFFIACIIQTLLLAALNVMPLIATTLVALILASLMGAALKQSLQKKKAMESKYYEAHIRTRELWETQLALVEREEKERRLLAQDLHDQVLNDLKKILEMFGQFEKNPNNELSNQIRSAFNKSMTDIREIMDDLYPVMLQSFGFRAALEDCLEKGKERSGYEIRFNCDVDEERLEKLSRVQQALLFRLVQESLTNISKHAAAKNVSITIKNSQNNLVIEVEDDGKGIDYKSVSDLSRGLQYMKNRALMIDATVDWGNGNDGKGTKVTITFPFTDDLKPKLAQE